MLCVEESSGSVGLFYYCLENRTITLNSWPKMTFDPGGVCQLLSRWVVLGSKVPQWGLEVKSDMVSRD